MIGHYLLTLSPEAEEAILTGKLMPGAYGTETERCLVGWAADVRTDGYGDFTTPRRPQHWISWQPKTERVDVENQYDNLCERFTPERVNVAIRNRILANQTRRTLADRRQSVSA